MREGTYIFGADCMLGSYWKPLVALINTGVIEPKSLCDDLISAVKVLHVKVPLRLLSKYFFSFAAPFAVSKGHQMWHI